MHSQAQSELLTPAEVAAFLYVDPKTVTRWAETGKLAAVRTPGGHRRYLRSEVLAIVAGLHPDARDHDSGTVPSAVQSPTSGAAAEVDSERQAAAAAVVAEAVALTLEAAAAEAAEAVLVTAAAVTEAAGRAAAAAERAREARAFAAEAAAQSVALEAERSATRVRDRAVVAAVRVERAASLAADELARRIEGGSALDAGLVAEVLAATVRAAADATDEDTTQAADAVKNADSAAAAQVAQVHAAAEEFVEREVTATAEAQRELATATAVAVALETDARAAGVALAAREAAAALLTGEQRADPVDWREGVCEHELVTPAREASASDRSQEVEEILAAAADRDSRAETRDRVADDREKAASLRAFVADRQHDDEEADAGGLSVRRAAALDRIDAMSDRASAASDRARLSGRRSSASGVSRVSAGASVRVSEAGAELSHDLRVPLTSIIASMEMLEDELRGHPDESIGALLGRAMRAGDRMVRMLDLNMMPGASGNALALPQVDLAEIVRELVLDSADLLDSVGAVVETSELPVVSADPDGMYSVLQNLLTNSVKFARPGVPARVRISARRTVDGWRISVHDNGVGLPDGSVLDVFSLFSRGTNSVAGHGIGLATVARIVADHGGRVGVTPVETGAEIWFELPDGDAVR